MNKQKNYNDFDYQTVLVKEDKLTEVITRYENFSWKKINSKQHSRYSNIVEVEFCRKHLINNKDELQFLQVNMECELNKKARLEKRKNSKSTTLGLILGLLGGGLIACSIWCFINLSLILGCVLGGVLAFLGIGVLIGEAFILKRFIKKENEKFNAIINMCENLIEGYCKQAISLKEVQDE